MINVGKKTSYSLLLIVNHFCIHILFSFDDMTCLLYHLIMMDFINLIEPTISLKFINGIL